MVHLYSNAGEPYRESASLTSSKQTITGVVSHLVQAYISCLLALDEVV
jgi:hypothetical protein